jgi:beta-glucanase (GH16 family)
VSSADLTSFHTYRIEWFSNLVRWFIDVQLVREDTAKVPQGAQSVHLNIWAPTNQWSDASRLVAPATTSAANNRISSMLTCPSRV